MRKKFFVTMLSATMICAMLTACGNKTDVDTETTTETVTTEEAPTEAEVIEVNTESDATTTEATEEDATDTEATEVNADIDEAGNVSTMLEDNDLVINVKAEVFLDNWYVNTDYKSMGKVTMYNVPTKEDAYSNSPRIQVAIQDQDTIDYYKESRENVTDIDSITINDVEYTGTTYTQYGMEWTEYVAQVPDTEEFVIIQISDVDITVGEGQDVLNSITFENVTSEHTEGTE